MVADVLDRRARRCVLLGRLRVEASSTMSGDDLANIEVRSGVSESGAGFCHVVATSQSGAIWLGQLTPDEIRAMALAWLETAEAADQDAAVLRCLRKLELPDELAGAIVAELRDSRGDDDD